MDFYRFFNEKNGGNNMNIKKLVMIEKITEEEVKTFKAKEIIKGYEFANKCLLNKYMNHNKEILRHNTEVLEKPYWTIMDELEDLW